MKFPGGGGGRGKDQFTPVRATNVCDQCGRIVRLPTHPLHPAYKKNCDCGGQFRTKRR